MPDTPGHRDELNRLDIVKSRPDADGEDGQRSDHETNFETVKQCPIAVGPDHPRQVMAHGAEGTDKEKNILCTPARLRRREDRNKQYRCTDEKDQISPAIENPRRRFRGGAGGGGWGLVRPPRGRPFCPPSVRSPLPFII